MGKLYVSVQLASLYCVRCVLSDTQATLAAVFSQTPPSAVMSSGSFGGVEETLQITPRGEARGPEMMSLPSAVDSGVGQYQIDALTDPGIGAGENMGDVPPLSAAPHVWNQQLAAVSGTAEAIEQVNLQRFEDMCCASSKSPT